MRHRISAHFATFLYLELLETEWGDSRRRKHELQKILSLLLVQLSQDLPEPDYRLVPLIIRWHIRHCPLQGHQVNGVAAKKVSEFVVI